jgi:hypothetical protein
VTWVGPLPGIETLRTHYVQQADVLTITYEFEGEIAAAGALIPLMFSDGREQAVITHMDQSVRTEYRGAYVESTALDQGAIIHLEEQAVAFRNGLLKEARIEVSGARGLTFSIRLGEVSDIN